MGQLGFTALSDQSSAFIPLPIADVIGQKPDGEIVANAFGLAGRVVVVANQPLLEAFHATNGQVSLLLYARPGTTNVIESTLGLNAPIVWSLAPDIAPVVMTNVMQWLPAVSAPNQARFYRARQAP